MFMSEFDENTAFSFIILPAAGFVNSFAAECAETGEKAQISRLNG